MNADDFGFSSSTNAGIREAAQHGCLTSTSLMATGLGFEEAVEEVLPECPGLAVGVHLNLTEGLAAGRSALLCDDDGALRGSFVSFLRGHRDAALAFAVEEEFRRQIEAVLERLPSIDHLNSHEHVHAIPWIFELTCRLAADYDVPFVRLPRERLHVARPLGTSLRAWHALNLVKVAVLRWTGRNGQRITTQHGVRANDWFVGVAHTGHMNVARVLAGVDALPRRPAVAELLLHPARILADGPEHYPSARARDYVLRPERVHELDALLDPALPTQLAALGWDLTAYRDVDAPQQAAPRRKPLPRVRFETRPPLRTVAIVDDTAFYHPEYVRRLVSECDDVDIVALAVVRLPHGGAIQKYLMGRLRDLGLRAFVKLALRRIGIQAAGLLPRAVRGDHEGSVAAVAGRAGIPHRVISSVKDEEFHEWLRSFAPELIVSSNALIFPDSLLRLPSVAAINRHSALLPSYGGVLPVFRAIQKGERFAGASVHYMTPDIDEGGVLSRKWIPIYPGDTLERLYRACFFVSYEATAEAARRLRADPTAAPLEAAGERSYYSFPGEEDWAEFKARGGRFV